MSYLEIIDDFASYTMSSFTSILTNVTGGRRHVNAEKPPSMSETAAEECRTIAHALVRAFLNPGKSSHSCIEGATADSFNDSFRVMGCGEVPYRVYSPSDLGWIPTEGEPN